jgi:hypothetical protein
MPLRLVKYSSLYSMINRRFYMSTKDWIMLIVCISSLLQVMAGSPPVDLLGVIVYQLYVINSKMKDHSE